MRPNQTHQADFVGPCYLKGPIRFYSLNIVDTATVRCGLHPSLSMTSQAVLDGFWAHGSGSASRSAYRLTMPCPFSAAEDIPVGWDH